MTWMVPLVAAMFDRMILAPLIRGDPAATLMARFSPSNVLSDVALATSAADSRPATT